MMKVYIDNMLVKSKQAVDHIDHLKQSFEIFIKYHMKLNPTKCSFGVHAGKFLGYMVTRRGIDANPDHIKAIVDTNSPLNFKEVQQLTGRMVALNSPNVVSVVLTREDEKQQLPIYYVSKSLLDAETRDQNTQADALANLGSALGHSSFDIVPIIHLAMPSIEMKTISTWFEIPSEIVCNNGSQFISDMTQQLCEDHNIKLTTSTPRYPQSNGLDESSNKTIINSIKIRLKAAKGKWVEEIPTFLWANRTMPQTSTGQTPFHWSMVVKQSFQSRLNCKPHDVRQSIIT
ncbi:hypothetical protein L6452_06002 [Arctium lappa]|uniref:Uncharacterized protein n=1 Tax=Arctium lappa TaxID=4217 RepID=A0ACB9EHH0_ARCLA|nr:hypothetical protein L6452_06002 [Arctium lappa]